MERGWKMENDTERSFKVGMKDAILVNFHFFLTGVTLRLGSHFAGDTHP